MRRRRRRRDLSLDLVRCWGGVLGGGDVEVGQSVGVIESRAPDRVSGSPQT